jgi:hypothetical protein
MIPTEKKIMIFFKQRLLPNSLLHELEIVTVKVGESTTRNQAPLVVAKFTGKRKIN